MLQPRARSLSQRIAAFALTCIVVLCVDVAVTFGLSALGSSLFSGDCRGKPLFVHPESPFHAVFTARVIFVGRSIEALTRDRGSSVIRKLRERATLTSEIGPSALLKNDSGDCPPGLVLCFSLISFIGKTRLTSSMDLAVGAIDPSTSDCGR